MKTPLIKTILQPQFPLGPLTVSGWIRTKREGKNTVFLELSDGSCQAHLQGVLLLETLGLQMNLSLLTTGACVRLQGTLTPSPAAGQRVELQVSKVELLGEAPVDTYPLQKKRHTNEFMREIAHLRPRTNTFGAVARVRSCLAGAIHHFFTSQNFFYVHTPIITASDCEGAGQMFQVTTLPLTKIPFTPQGQVDYSQDFFGKQAHLTVSGQLNGETHALALGRIYTFGPTFRAENSNTTRHLAEFWMIEPEAAFYDLNDNMDLAEEFLQHLINTLLLECPQEMAFFDQWVEKGLVENLKLVANTPFHRITYTEAIEILKTSGHPFEYLVHWGVDLQSEHEKYLTDQHFKGPVIVTDYPKEIKAFYMKLNPDGKTVRAMDVLVPRLGEIIGGSQREENLDKLLERMAELGLKEEDYWWYLDLRRFGSAPHSGFGLGFERLIQYATGMTNIRDVIPFPRAVKNADF